MVALLMQRFVLHSKIHGARVTHADLNYVGSVTIDRDLLEAVDLVPNEKILVINCENGERFETYVFEGTAGSGVIGMNGVSSPYPVSASGVPSASQVTLSVCGSMSKSPSSPAWALRSGVKSSRPLMS